MIFPRSVVLGFLLFLGSSGAVSDLSLFPFHFTIVKDLKASEMLLLESPESLFFFLSIFCRLSLSDLLASLVQDGVPLLLVKTFKVIGLDSVGCKHRLFRRWVLSHEIVAGGVLNVSALLQQLVDSI